MVGEGQALDGRIAQLEAALRDATMALAVACNAVHDLTDVAKQGSGAPHYLADWVRRERDRAMEALTTQP